MGVNQDAAEIKMTRPVTTQVIPQKRTRTIDEEMCFWLGTPYELRDPPKPIGKIIILKIVSIVHISRVRDLILSKKDCRMLIIFK